LKVQECNLQYDVPINLDDLMDGFRMYLFTTDWFAQTAKVNWAKLLPEILPSRILEIGCFEGASTCYLIDTLAKIVP